MELGTASITEALEVPLIITEQLCLTFKRYVPAIMFWEPQKGSPILIFLL